MPDAVTDTHALIWYLEDSPRLGPRANQIFSQCDRGEVVIYVPTICLVEIVYLQEKGRIPAGMKAQFDAEFQSGTNGMILADLTAEVVKALVKVPRDRIPDLPDRVIAATALHLGLPLISQDTKIQMSEVDTVW